MRITTLRLLPIVLQLRAFVCLCMFVWTHNKMTVFIPRYFMTSAKPKKKKLAADSLAFFFGEFSETYTMLSFYYC